MISQSDTMVHVVAHSGLTTACSGFTDVYYCRGARHFPHVMFGQLELQGDCLIKHTIVVQYKAIIAQPIFQYSIAIVTRDYL